MTLSYISISSEVGLTSGRDTVSSERYIHIFIPRI
jgi:hypothetical protein